MEELRALLAYQTQGEGEEDNTNEAEFVDDDDSESDTAAQQVPQHVPQQTSFTFTKSTIEESRRHHRTLNDTELALSLWCTVYGVSRKQYAALHEILMLMEPGEIQRLPRCIDTLKRHGRENLPLQEIRKATINLDAEKLPTARRQAAEGLSFPNVGTSLSSTNLFFFNPISIYKRVLQSALSKNMFFGMAQLVDSPTEMWHSVAWASSIRTTSGNFARYEAGDYAGEVILPADIVLYRCNQPRCQQCSSNRFHCGQVCSIWTDHRSNRLLGPENTAPEQATIGAIGAIVLQIRRLAPLKAILCLQGINEAGGFVSVPRIDDAKDRDLVAMDSPADLYNTGAIIKPFTDLPGKLLIPIPSLRITLTCPDIIVFFDTSTGSAVSLPSDITYPADAQVVRYTLNFTEKVFTPLAQAKPIRAALEIKHFGRQALLSLATQDRVKSLPLLCFVDGFGLYRSMYKSLMGIYLTPCCLPAADQKRLYNTLPLALGPHGSALADVMAALEPMTGLDQGITVEIDGENIVLFGPILAFTGDMPQQQVNAGCLGPTARQGCRFCTTDIQYRGDLERQIHGAKQRGHYEILRVKQHATTAPTPTSRDRILRSHGLTTDLPAVANIAPALDLVWSRPSDSAHSEFGGITKLLHQLLIDQAFTLPAMALYCSALRTMPSPPGWKNIQSPYHVLSYTLQEHGRWAVKAAVLFRIWLRDAHLKPAFKSTMEKVFKPQLAHGTLSDIFGKDSQPTASQLLATVLAAVVRSSSILTAAKLTPDLRKGCNSTIIEARKLFQLTCEAAARTSSRRRTGKTPGLSRAVSIISHVDNTAARFSMPPPTIAPPVAQFAANDDNSLGLQDATNTQKAKRYQQWIARPNIHSGLHYKALQDEYGLVSLLMVLTGEQKHK
jgi:hypothetical protein